jgi:hypothetical protein
VTFASQVAASVTVSGGGLQNPAVYVPPASPMVNSNAPGGAPSGNLALAPGLNNVAVPAGATSLTISRTPGNTNTLFAGLAATGFPLGTIGFAVLPIGFAPATVPIYSTGAETVEVAWG